MSLTIGSYRTYRYETDGPADLDGPRTYEVPRSDWAWSGTSGDLDYVEEFVRLASGRGGITLEPLGSRPSNHHLIGRSMAAYYENGEAFDGLRWWEDESRYSARKYYEVSR